MLFKPVIEVKPVEADAHFADRDLGDEGPDLAVEDTVGHAEVGIGIFQPEDARGRGHASVSRRPLGPAAVLWIMFFIPRYSKGFVELRGSSSKSNARRNAV